MQNVPTGKMPPKRDEGRGSMSEAAGVPGTAARLDTPPRQAARPDYWIRRTQQLVAEANARGQDVVTIESGPPPEVTVTVALAVLEPFAFEAVSV